MAGRTAPKRRIAHRTCPRHYPGPVGSASNGVVMMRYRTGQDVLEYELLGEQAATIGRLARELRAALDVLDAFDRRVSDGRAGRRDSRRRAQLVEAAAYALWHFVVQRECSGFRGTEQVLEDYAVPTEVRMKMGAVGDRGGGAKPG